MMQAQMGMNAPPVAGNGHRPPPPIHNNQNQPHNFTKNVQQAPPGMRNMTMPLLDTLSIKPLLELWIIQRGNDPKWKESTTTYMQQSSEDTTNLREREADQWKRIDELRSSHHQRVIQKLVAQRNEDESNPNYEWNFKGVKLDRSNKAIRKAKLLGLAYTSEQHAVVAKLYVILRRDLKHELIELVERQANINGARSMPGDPILGGHGLQYNPQHQLHPQHQQQGGSALAPALQAHNRPVMPQGQHQGHPAQGMHPQQHGQPMNMQPRPQNQPHQQQPPVPPPILINNNNNTPPSNKPAGNHKGNNNIQGHRRSSISSGSDPDSDSASPRSSRKHIPNPRHSGSFKGHNSSNRHKSRSRSRLRHNTHDPSRHHHDDHDDAASLSSDYSSDGHQPRSSHTSFSSHRSHRPSYSRHPSHHTLPNSIPLHDTPPINYSRPPSRPVHLPRTVSYRPSGYSPRAPFRMENNMLIPTRPHTSYHTHYHNDAPVPLIRNPRPQYHPRLHRSYSSRTAPPPVPMLEDDYPRNEREMEHERTVREHVDRGYARGYVPQGHRPVRPYAAGGGMHRRFSEEGYSSRGSTAFDDLEAGIEYAYDDYDWER